MTRGILLHVGLLALFVVAACNRGGPFGPDNQPEFSNDTNLFQWRATAMENVTETQSFTWQNTGGWAVVQADPDLNGGNALLRIWGAAATPVFARDLEMRLTAPTLLDTAGAWTIEIRLSGASGSLDIRVETP